MENRIDRIKPPLILKCKTEGCESKSFKRIVITWTQVTEKREYVARCKQIHPAVKQVSFVCIDCDDFVWRSDVLSDLSSYHQ